MNITFKKLLVLIAFISFSYAAKAQYSAVSDTARIAIGPDFMFPFGKFESSYKIGIGASIQADIPLNEKFYVTGNVGFASYTPATGGANPEYIVGVKTANLNIAPLKIGLKYYLIRTFYIQAEAGESILLNKTAAYALDGSAFTYGPQMGILFKLKHRNYIDGGVRWQRTQSFFGDGTYNSTWGVRVAYAYSIK